MNGLEIDLAELEMFEKQLADKRKSKPNVSANVVQSTNSPDELDMYLDRLAIDISARDNAKHVNDASTAPMPSTSSMQHNDGVATQCSVADEMVAKNNSNKSTVDGIDSTTPLASLAKTMPKTSLPLLLYGFLSILVFINSVCYSKRRTTDIEMIIIH